MADSSSPHDDACTRAAPIADPDASVRVAAWLLSGPLTVVLCVLAAVQLATWIPHYVTWPMWSDHDVHATLAQAWDQGQLPYRDMKCNSFPGSIYLFWILGKLFGWGHSFPIYAADAMLVVALGAVLGVWSYRQFASLLPGVIGYLAFLSFYLSLDYALAAQRDFHAPAVAILGILIAQTTQSRWGRCLMALALAVAVIVRPQTVLFLPAICFAIDESARRPGEPLLKTLGACLRSGVLFALFVSVLFAPLLVAGVFADFLRAIERVGYGGEYNRVTAISFLSQFLSQAAPLQFLLVPAATVLLSRPGDPASRRTMLTWLAVFGGVSLYRPLSPFPHAYLSIPLMLAWSVNFAILVYFILTACRPSPALRLAAVFLALSVGITVRPQFCLLGSTRRVFSMGFLENRGTEVPPGYRHGVVPSSAFYPWRDYCAVVTYLHHATRSETKLANALKGAPALVGTTARQSAFPAESLAWLWLVDRDDEPEFAAALVCSRDSVVIWIPGEIGPDPTFVVDRIDSVIRDLYQPEARFGAIEVWRRKPDS